MTKECRACDDRGLRAGFTPQGDKAYILCGCVRHAGSFPLPDEPARSEEDGFEDLVYEIS